MKKSAISLTLMLTLLSNFIFAQAGVIDSTFGTDGILFIPNITTCLDVVEDDSMAIILGYAAQNESELHTSYYRINYNGVMDIDFGQGGQIKTPDSLGFLALNIEAFDNDRFISFGSNVLSDVASVYTGSLFRYFYDGQIDTSFGDHGVVNFDIADDLEYAFGLQVLEDKKILVSYNIWQKNLVLRRFLPDGAIDYDFGDLGSAEILLPDGYHDFFAPLIKIQNDRIVLMGGMNNDNVDDGIAVVKLHLDGTLDMSFGQDGWVHVPIKKWEGDGYNYCQLMSDGKMHFSGTANDSLNAGNNLLVTVQLNSNGALDVNYGEDGLSIIPFPFDDDLHSIYSSALQPDGKILLTGTLGDSWQVVCRLNSNGTLDHSFGTNGFSYWFSFDYSESVGLNISLMADKSIWSLGYTFDDNDDLLGIVTKFKSGLLTNNYTPDIKLIPMSVFPNPVKENIQVQFDLDNGGEVAMDLMTLAGKKVVHWDRSWFVAGKHKANYTLPANLPSGNYLLTLQVGHQFSSFVVNVK